MVQSFVKIQDGLIDSLVSFKGQAISIAGSRALSENFKLLHLLSAGCNRCSLAMQDDDHSFCLDSLKTWHSSRSKGPHLYKVRIASTSVWHHKGGKMISWLHNLLCRHQSSSRANKDTWPIHERHSLYTYHHTLCRKHCRFTPGGL